MQHDHAYHVRRLLDWYDGAPEDIKADGRAWYSEQREIIRELSEQHKLTVETVAAVVAALSPMTRWTENVAGSIRMLRAREMGSSQPPRNCTLFYKNACKAWQILDGADPHVLFSGSPKVRAFWRNLMGDESEVTVDTWMIRAVGEGDTFANGLKPKPYREIAQAVQDAAHMVGETAAQFQAIVWLQIRLAESRYETANEGRMAA